MLSVTARRLAVLQYRRSANYAAAKAGGFTSSKAVEKFEEKAEAERTRRFDYSREEKR